MWDHDKKDNMEDIAQKERDETLDEEERNLDTEGNSAHPSLDKLQKKKKS